MDGRTKSKGQSRNDYRSGVGVEDQKETPSRSDGYPCSSRERLTIVKTVSRTQGSVSHVHPRRKT